MGAGRLRASALAASILAASGVSGCGFTPLYATPGLSSGLSAIEVVVPEGRVPYLLREDLDDALARDKTSPPRWRLELTVVQTRDPRGLTQSGAGATSTAVAQRFEIGLTVTYRLISVADGTLAHAGQVSTEVSYDAADAPYAGIAARQDTQERAAADAARRIEIDLAAYMARAAAH